VDDLMENVWGNQDAIIGHGVDIALPVRNYLVISHLSYDWHGHSARIACHRGSRQVFLILVYGLSRGNF